MQVQNLKVALWSSAFQPYMFITDDHMGHVRLRVKMNLHIHSDFPALTC